MVTLSVSGSSPVSLPPLFSGAGRAGYRYFDSWDERPWAYGHKWDQVAGTPMPSHTLMHAHALHAYTPYATRSPAHTRALHTRTYTLHAHTYLSHVHTHTHTGADGPYPHIHSALSF